MKKQKGRFITLDRNSERSTFKLVVYWNEYAKTDAPQTTFYSYDKFDTVAQTYDEVYALRKLFKLANDFHGQYKTIIIYDNQELNQQKQELAFLSGQDHKILLRNKYTASKIMNILKYIN